MDLDIELHRYLMNERYRIVANRRLDYFQIFNHFLVASNQKLLYRRATIKFLNILLVLTSDAAYFVVAIVMGILSPFLVIFLPTTLISFTKLRFRRSFWVAQHIWILIVSKATTENTKMFNSLFYSFVDQKLKIYVP